MYGERDAGYFKETALSNLSNILVSKKNLTEDHRQVLQNTIKRKAPSHRRP